MCSTRFAKGRVLELNGLTSLATAACVSWLLLSPALHADDITDQRLDKIERELAEIKAILQRIEKKSQTVSPRAQPRDAMVDIVGRPYLGNADAPVTLVAFTDYQCPFCSRFFATTMPALRKQYIDTGKLKYVVKDLPLSMHPYAQLAAEATHCAGEQEHFWEMHDALFANSRLLDETKIRGLARQISLDMNAFEQCVSSGLYKQDVLRDVAEARRQGINATPMFVLTNARGDTIRGQIIRGYQSFDNLKSRIDAIEPSKEQ